MTRRNGATRLMPAPNISCRGSSTRRRPRTCGVSSVTVLSAAQARTRAHALTLAHVRAPACTRAHTHTHTQTDALTGVDCPTAVDPSLNSVQKCESAVYNQLGFAHRKQLTPDLVKAEEYYDKVRHGPRVPPALDPIPSPEDSGPVLPFALAFSRALPLSRDGTNAQQTLERWLCKRFKAGMR